MTDSELNEYENKFLGVCREICGLYYQELENKITQNSRDYIYRFNTRRKFNANVGIIKFRGRTIRLRAGYSKTVTMSFHGKISSGGTLKITFDLTRTNIRISCGNFFNYPFNNEIIKLIIEKYDLKDSKDIEEFIEKIKNKNIELV